MVENLVRLQEALPSQPMGNKEVAELIVLITQEDVPIICINKAAGKKRSMPFKALYDNNSRFWLQGGNWDYFLAAEDLTKIKEKLTALKAAGWKPRAINNPAAERLKGGVLNPSAQINTGTEEDATAADIGVLPVINGFGKEYNAIAAMTEVERIGQINEDKKRLDSLIMQKPRDARAVTEALTDTTRDAALVNHVTLLGAMNLVDAEAKKRTQNLVNLTCDLVQSSTQLITADIFNDELMNTLVSKSNGTIIQHMTRVYLNGIAFLSYYNKLVSTSSIINKLKISFDKNYRVFYRPLLPHLALEDITLRQVFLGGMRAIPETSFFNWAVGFLVHDIGKASAVEYHEGEAAYNRDIVVEHVKLGYDSIMNKTNYPRDAGLITGYHHEYYGDSGGYGCFRNYLEQYKKAKPWAKQDFCITFDSAPLIDLKALGYFPAKVLEIIDVYDSVTDPNRKYRKAMSPEEALTLMREEFIEKHHKIDAILFDIFASFVREKAKA